MTLVILLRDVNKNPFKNSLQVHALLLRCQLFDNH